MHIHEYQEWLETWDKARGWDKILPAHTLIHAVEEMGEVARLVLALDGYKEALDEDRWRAELAEELSDLFVFLFKLAYQAGIDMEEALKAGQAKAEIRFPDLEEALAAGEHYRRTLRQRVRELQRKSESPSA